MAYEYNTLPINVSLTLNWIKPLEEYPSFKEFLSHCSRYRHKARDQYRRGQYNITGKMVSASSIYILHGDRSVCEINIYPTKVFDQDFDGALAKEVIVDIVSKSKKISIEGDSDITLYIEDNGIDYVKLHSEVQGHMQVYLKRVGYEIESLVFIYSHERGWRNNWCPISALLNGRENHILSRGVISNTFIQKITTKQEIQLLPYSNIARITG